MFAELSITSNFTFLTGASHPEEFMQRAARCALSAIAIADDNSVAGIVRAHTEAREIARAVRQRQAFDAAHGLIGPPAPEPAPPDPLRRALPRLIPAARLVFTDAPPITALVQSRRGWAGLCRLLSRGRLRAEKGSCILHLADLLEMGAEGLHLALHGPPGAQVAPPGAGAWWPQAQQLTRRFGGQMSLLMAPAYDGADAARFDHLASLAAELGLPTLAPATPLMHAGPRRRLADVLSAIREGTTVEALGARAQPNGERRLRSEAEMLRLFRGHEAAVARAEAAAAAAAAAAAPQPAGRSPDGGRCRAGQ